jgi:hypothetical protein
MSKYSYYQIPEKVRVINSTTKTPITFRDAANATAAATAATILSVEGFGRFDLTGIVSATLSRGLTPTLQKFSITAATASEITYVAPASPTRVWIKIDLESVARDFKNARNQYEFGRTIELEITANPTDTVNTFLAKIYNALFANTSSRTNKQLFVKPGSGTAGTITNDVATTLTELEIELSDRNDFIKSFTVTGDNFLASTVLTVFAPTQIVAFNKGINYGFDVEMHQKRTTFNNWAYGHDYDEIPVENALYTSVVFEITPSRILKQDSNLSDRNRLVLFLNESTCSTVISNLADFMNQLTNETFNAIVTSVYTYGVTAAQFKTNA